MRSAKSYKFRGCFSFQFPFALFSSTLGPWASPNYPSLLLATQAIRMSNPKGRQSLNFLIRKWCFFIGFTVKMQTLIIASFVICAKPNSQIRLAPSCSFNYLLICFVFQCLEASSQPKKIKVHLGRPRRSESRPPGADKVSFS